MEYFSEREFGPHPRTGEKITPAAWRGILSAIITKMEDGSFGYWFPDVCTDSGRNLPVGTNYTLMRDAVLGEFPRLEWPLRRVDDPSTYDVLDLVQFCYQRVASVVGRDYHDYMQHYHLFYDPEKGRAEFRELINRIFARNELAFELDEEGQIIRMPAVVLRESLRAATFATGDHDLDELLEIARRKFQSHDPVVRKEGLEKLWDAWERLKTLDVPEDKKRSVGVLLDRMADEPKLRETLDAEARALTDVGNGFMIRHTEVNKIPIRSPEHVDYLFHRLFALIRLALRSTGRGG
jgi:AbiJ N-terminal domain 4